MYSLRGLLGTSHMDVEMVEPLFAKPSLPAPRRWCMHELTENITRRLAALHDMHPLTRERPGEELAVLLDQRDAARRCDACPRRLPELEATFLADRARVVALTQRDDVTRRALEECVGVLRRALRTVEE